MPTPTATPFAAVPLGRFVNATQWEADDLAGRTSTVAHAAFHRAGFVPCDALPTSGDLLLKHVAEIGPSAPTLSRRYTAPQLVAHGEAEEVAVLEIRAQGDGDVAFQAYLLLTSESDGGGCRIRRCSCEAVLREADLAPILSGGGLDDAACALEGSWLWKSLADGVCRVLFLELCRWNDLPVMEFMSLPDDLKVEIFKRLPGGKDLAKVECCSRPLRRLMAERDGVAWKAMYKTGLGLVAEEEEAECVNVPFTWKQRYVYAEAAQPPRPLRRYLDELRTRIPESFREFLARTRVQLPPPLPLPPYALFPLRLENPFIMEPASSPLSSGDQLRTSFAGGEFLAKFVPPTWRRFDFELNTLQMENLSIMKQHVLETMDFFMPPFIDPPTLPKVVARRRQYGGGRHRKVPQKDCKKKQHGTGATHSPSSRYRWRHR